MKILFLTVFLAYFSSCLSQDNINRKNYYTFFKNDDALEKIGIKDLTTSHLDEFLIAQILSEEMRAAGFEWIVNYSIINVEAEKYVVSICYSGKQNVGFLLEKTFSRAPKESTRNFRSLCREDFDFDYIEKVVFSDGSLKFVIIDKVPENLFIIKLDLYWYQTAESEEIKKGLVSKDKITEIFKQDIREVLAKFKK